MFSSCRCAVAQLSYACYHVIDVWRYRVIKLLIQDVIGLLLVELLMELLGTVVSGGVSR